MRRPALWLLLALVPSCAAPPAPAPTAVAAPQDAPRFCRPGLAGEARQAERGIGGTGIVGVITGFGSVCINRLEVGLDAAAPVEIDGTAAPGTALRAGQLVAIAAAGSGAALHADRIAVRHEVSGPVEAVQQGGGGLIVAGQRVAILPATRGDRHPGPGAWIAVSGLRAPDGSILATRVDQRAPGRVSVHGTLRRGGDGMWRIGALNVQPPPGRAATDVVQVVVTGRYSDGVLLAETLASDLLAADPPGYFGATVQRLVIAAFVSLEGGRVRLGGGFAAAASPSVAAALARPGPAVVALERRDNGFRVVNVIDRAGHVAVPQGFPWVSPPADFAPELPGAPAAAPHAATPGGQGGDPMAPPGGGGGGPNPPGGQGGEAMSGPGGGTGFSGAAAGGASDLAPARPGPASRGTGLHAPGYAPAGTRGDAHMIPARPGR